MGFGRMGFFLACIFLVVSFARAFLNLRLTFGRRLQDAVVFWDLGFQVREHTRP